MVAIVSLQARDERRDARVYQRQRYKGMVPGGVGKDENPEANEETTKTQTLQREECRKNKSKTQVRYYGRSTTMGAGRKSEAMAKSHKRQQAMFASP